MDSNAISSPAPTARTSHPNEHGPASKKAIRPFNPCPFRCIPPGCTLKISCLVFGVIEITVWVVVLIVVASLLAAVEDSIKSHPKSQRQLNSESLGHIDKRSVITSLRRTKPGSSAGLIKPEFSKNPGSSARLIKPDYTKDDKYIDTFIIVGAMFVAASITAGLTLTLGTLYRAPILCLVHTGFAVFIVGLLLFLVVLEIVAGSFYTIASSLILTIPYGYFALCSYALAMHIQTGTDSDQVFKRNSIGIQRAPNVATKPPEVSNGLSPDENEIQLPTSEDMSPSLTYSS